MPVLTLLMGLVFAFTAVPGHSRELSEQSGGFTPESFERFVEALGSVQTDRVFAYHGTAYDHPSGRVIATVEGYQRARVFRDGRPDQAFLVRRAFLLYRDPTSGSMLKIYPDVRASVTRPPLSITRYTLSGDRVISHALSGVSGSARAVAVPESLHATREGERFVFRRVMAPPNPAEQPLEIQETTLMPRASTGTDVRTVMTKVANNTFLPPNGGRHLLHLVWYPVSGESALGGALRRFLADEAPGLRSLPGSLNAALRELGVDTWPAGPDAADAKPAN
jgi:hypothetical protein